MPRGELGKQYRGGGGATKWFQTTDEILTIQKGFNNPQIGRQYHFHKVEKELDEFKGFTLADAAHINRLAGSGGRGAFRYVFDKQGRIRAILQHQGNTFRVLHRF